MGHLVRKNRHAQDREHDAALGRRRAGKDAGDGGRRRKGRRVGRQLHPGAPYVRAGLPAQGDPRRSVRAGDGVQARLGLPGARGPVPAPRGGQARKSWIWTAARATTCSGSGSQGTASCAACRSGCSGGIPKAVAVADPAGTIANFAGSERGVERALARRRLSMHCRLVVDEQVAAGCGRTARPVPTTRAPQSITSLRPAGPAAGGDIRWPELVGATTCLAGEFRVFCSGSVAGEARRILGWQAREQWLRGRARAGRRYQRMDLIGSLVARTSRFHSAYASAILGLRCAGLIARTLSKRSSLDMREPLAT